jgi:hypothetical protein
MKKTFIALLLMTPLVALIVAIIWLLWSHPEAGGHIILGFFVYVAVGCSILVATTYLFMKGLSILIERTDTR